jgi:gamma-glutamyltranspeptidase/glutathione hydrolase
MSANSLRLQRVWWSVALVCVAGAGVIRVSTQQAEPPKGNQRQAGSDTNQRAQPPRTAHRPAVMGSSGGVSAGHPLTTAAGFEILLKGGNAFDAGVASLLVGGLVEQDLYSLGGEALVLVYPKKEAKVTSVVGQGWAPKAVDVDCTFRVTGPCRVRGSTHRSSPAPSTPR